MTKDKKTVYEKKYQEFTTKQRRKFTKKIKIIYNKLF